MRSFNKNNVRAIKAKKPELLAPAGSLSTGVAAIDSGADAIYCGLQKFNARERTDNFSIEEMSKLINYAHKNCKKVYITFNTLIKESEIFEAAQMIKDLAILSPDAIIIQDLGVLYIVKKYFPQLNLHASTQMGFHNSAGVNMAQRLGFSRVILERQITIEEIKSIKENSSLELELFIHGALCCSISGNCLFSSWQGGYSGNRGKCKQPCRKFYSANNGESGFLFSTKDLRSLESIAMYSEIGVSSLKIEGRLKKADYVSNVVDAYRTILDTGDISLAKRKLDRATGRTTVSGFFVSDDFKHVIDHKNLGISGQLCGKVLDTRYDGFKALLSNNIHIGDRVRVQPITGEEGPSFTITKIIVNGEDVKKCYRGGTCFIKCDRSIPNDGTIYKIGESGGDYESFIKRLPEIGKKITLNIVFNSGGVIVSSNPLNIHWSKEVCFAEAIKNSLTKEQVINEFSSTKSEKYFLGGADVKIEGNLFVPSSLLKEIRRNFWDYFISTIDDSLFSKDVTDSFLQFKAEYETRIRNTNNIIEASSVLVGENENSSIPGSVIVHTLDDFNSTTQEILLPNFCFEYDLSRIRRKIDIAIDKGIKNFRVTSLYQYSLLSKYKNLSISISYPLPAANSFAVEMLNLVGKKSCLKSRTFQVWIELEYKEIMNLIEKSSYALEIYYFGRPFILASRAYISANKEIHDKSNEEFIIKKDLKQGLCYLYANLPFKSKGIEKVSKFFDLTNAALNEESVSSFNLNRTFF